MKGRIEIGIANNRAKYKFTLERNITVVRGDSGTGKTTLYDMVAEYMRLGEASGVRIASTCPCVALTDMDWRNQLSHTRGSVVFIDEGAVYLASRDFASAIQETDNYYVSSFTRERRCTANPRDQTPASSHGCSRTISRACLSLRMARPSARRWIA